MTQRQKKRLDYGRPRDALMLQDSVQFYRVTYISNARFQHHFTFPVKGPSQCPVFSTKKIPVLTFVVSIIPYITVGRIVSQILRR